MGQQLLESMLSLPFVFRRSLLIFSADPDQAGEENASTPASEHQGIVIRFVLFIVLLPLIPDCGAAKFQ